MVTKDEIKHLSSLSRLGISDNEIQILAKDLDGILDYVKQLEKLSISKELSPNIPLLHNVFREDGEPTQSGTNTDIITSSFPNRSENYLSVKKIL